jgi:hypothetical protein
MGLIVGSVGAGRSFGVLGQLEDEGELIEAWQAGFWRDGAWQSSIVLEFMPVALAAMPQRPNSWVVLGQRGQVAWLDTSQASAVCVREDSIGNGHLPAFTTITPFRGGMAATGMGRAVWWSQGGPWEPLGSGLPDRGKEICGLESLVADGDLLHAFGWNGEGWTLDGQAWRRLDLPSNLILPSATVTPQGDLAVCGQHGTLLRGRQDLWRPFGGQPRTVDFWSIAAFRGQLYVASMTTLLTVTDDALKVVDDGQENGDYYHLSSNDEILLSVGNRAILCTTDGKEWQRIK